MKRLIFPIAAVLAMGTVTAQNSAWVPSSVGYLTGVGTTSPVFPMHFHGTTKLSPTDVPFSSWIGFTNTNTGATVSDGTLLRQTGTSFYVDNQEGSNITLTSGIANLNVMGSLGRIGVNTTSINSTSTFAALNVLPTTDNGLYIRTYQSGKYGLSIRMANSADNAIQVLSSLTTQNAFTVKNNGQVRIYANGVPANDEIILVEDGTRRLLQLEQNGLLYAREIKVNTDTWMDVVFEPGYELRPLNEVEAYIEKEGHLPEVPSATEVIRDGINVGEMNKLLLQKIEELTLYVIEQDKRIKELEGQQENR